MDFIAALLAAVAATGFTIDLAGNWRRRPRPHAAAWTVAMGAYALATWALVLGLGAGWNPTSFRLFYWLGAITNIPFLAAGSVYLVLGPRAGKRFTIGVVIWTAFGAWVTWATELTSAVSGEGVPEGSELFPWTATILDISVPGPRVFAAIAGGLATLIIVGLALYSVVRFRKSNRRLAGGNLLIMAGTIAPALGGTLTALGEAAGLAIMLLVGAVLLWSGYRMASGARGSRAGVRPRDAIDASEPLGP